MACSMHLLVQFCLLATFSICDAYRILVMSSIPGRSHVILGDGLIRHITKAGHEVTYVTSMPKEKPWPNVTEVDVGEKIRPILKDVVNVQKILDKENEIIDVTFVIKLMHAICVMSLEDDNMQKLMKDPKQKFDLIIAEWMFTDIYAGLAAVFDCPFIWFATVEPHWLVLNLIDEVPNPAYNPDMMSSDIPPFSFVQRLLQLSYQIRIMIHQYFTSHPRENKDYERLLAPIIRGKGKPVPSFEELRHNASLMLGNSHVSLGLPTRLPQNYKPIGGYHIESNVKPLPENLQKIIDSATNGAIYFSLGSNLKSKELPVSIKTGLLKMFGQLKQTVIWKFEEDLPNRPKNVHIVDWAPQPSILGSCLFCIMVNSGLFTAHPNCVLFITHGGYLSSTETVHFGVPVIGVPVYGDQFNNIDRAVRKGYALRVDLSYAMAENLKAAITEILTVPKYRERVKELSLIYHDRPISPGDEVAHWVQHVIRTRGAPHLRSLALNVPWYQKMYLDLLAIFLMGLLILKYLLTTLLTTLRQSTNINEKKKK